MLSRTADNLYWLARYMERAENLARILHVADRMSMMPAGDSDTLRSEWQSALVISGCEEPFEATGEAVTAANVIDYIGRNPDNHSSIFSCVRSARDNARAIRNAITSEMWESLNSTWLDFDEQWNRARANKEIRPFLEWVKERSSLFRGSFAGTMIRDEGYHFTRLGTFLERGDNTARILDVKYHVLLPETEAVGGGIDYLQWSTVLRAVSALGSYHWLYHENPRPWHIAEFLILREEMPRSLVHCLRGISRTLDAIAEDQGVRHECHRMAGKMYSHLRYSSAEEVFQTGLHEFLTEFVVRNNDLGNLIAKNYLLLE
jgi:uncharacterized alpha-E superfamily protein